METRWLYVTSENFPALREASKGTCIIPMGCVEKHGLHLPLGTDILEASRATYLASQLETVCVFPDFTFGDVQNNCPVTPDGFMPAGSITLDMELEFLLLEKLAIITPIITWGLLLGIRTSQIHFELSGLSNLEVQI